jgi:hypothetical protein
MVALDLNTLIDQHTGEVIESQVRSSAIISANSRYGNDATDLDVDHYEDQLRGLAQILRNRWRKAHGLVDDTKYTMIRAFGRQRSGLRWGAF